MKFFIYIYYTKKKLLRKQWVKGLAFLSDRGREYGAMLKAVERSETEPAGEWRNASGYVDSPEITIKTIKNIL